MGTTQDRESNKQKTYTKCLFIASDPTLPLSPLPNVHFIYYYIQRQTLVSVPPCSLAMNTDDSFLTLVITILCVLVAVLICIVGITAFFVGFRKNGNQQVSNLQNSANHYEMVSRNTIYKLVYFFLFSIYIFKNCFLFRISFGPM